MRSSNSNRWWLVIPAAVLLAALGWLGTGPFADEPDPHITKLISQLGDEDFAQREAASRALEELGEAALPAVRKAAANPDPEIRYRAERIIRHVWFGSRTTGLALVAIPAGEFNMGSPKGEAGRSDDETLHVVRVTKPFLLAKFEVTQQEFERVMGRNPSSFSLTGNHQAQAKLLDKAELRSMPVENVTWFDALEFCNKLSELDGWQPYYELTGIERNDGVIIAAHVKQRGGRGYRLPTEAEWEYACRARTEAPFYFGKENTGTEANVKPVMLPAVGYGGGGPKFHNIGRPIGVGTFPANPWGLGEMHGNVAEWCWDRYLAGYYSESPAADPAGPDEGKHRVVRGGSWIVPEENCRSASRFWLTPNDRRPHVGFRVARSE